MYTMSLNTPSFSGLFKGEKKDDDRQCQVKWEEVWKPHCTTTYEELCRNEPKQVKLDS